MGVAGLQHEVGRMLQLSSLLRTKQVARIMRHGPEGEGLAARDPQPDFLAVHDLRDARVVRNRQAIGITGNGARFAARERRNGAQVASAECLPSRAVVGKEDVAGNLEDDEAEGEDVGRLVVLSAEDFPGDILAVTLALDALGSWPGGCQAKVANLEITIKSDENVGRFNIQVDKTSLVNRR